MEPKSRVEITKEEAEAIEALYKRIHREEYSARVGYEKAYKKIVEKSGLDTLKLKLADLEKEHKKALADIKSEELDKSKRAAKRAAENRKFSKERKKLVLEILAAEKQIEEVKDRVSKVVNTRSMTRQKIIEQISELEYDIADKLTAQSESASRVTELTNERNRILQDINQLQLELSKIEGDSIDANTRRAELSATIEALTKSTAEIKEEIANSESLGSSAAEEAAAAMERHNKLLAISLDIDAQRQSQAESLKNAYAEINKITSNIEEVASERMKIELDTEMSSEDKALRLKELESREKFLQEQATILDKHIQGLEKNRSTEDAGTKKSIADKVEKNKQDRNVERAQKKENKEVAKAENAEIAKEEWKDFMSKDGMKDAGSEALANAVGNLSNKLSDFAKSIDDNITTFYSYQASVDARLQGSEDSYQDSLKMINKNIAFSPIITQKAMIEKLRELVDKGIAYNVDVRAFLATVSDKIATTFDAFDSNLLRVIRLQQADTTAARLGMEAALTKWFNTNFSDTSYLSDAFDNVTQAITDASSQLTRDASLQFEYVVQKWLGALYSVGLSQTAVDTIAQGINYLGTGNVEALNSNDSLNSLLAMSASRAGISYADILTGGLDADTTNSLLKSMVEYLRSIASNTDNNQVTKAAYTNLYGISMSDLQAINNLQTTDIDVIEASMQSYESSMQELNNQFGQLSSRVHLSQKLDNIMENALSSASTNIGNSPGAYGLWKTLNIIEGLTGGIPIPMISVMGNTVDLKQTVTGIAKLGVAGLSLMGTLLGSLGSGVGGTYNLQQWDFDEYTTRGTQVTRISKGTASGVSESSELGMTGSSSGEDVKQTSMSDATSDAEEDSKITNAGVEGNADIYEEIRDALVKDEVSVLDVANEILGAVKGNAGSSEILTQIAGLLAPERIFYTLDTLAIGARDDFSTNEIMLPVNTEELYTSVSSVLNQTIATLQTSGVTPVVLDALNAVSGISEQISNSQLPNEIVSKIVNDTVTTSDIASILSASNIETRHDSTVELLAQLITNITTPESNPTETQEILTFDSSGLFDYQKYDDLSALKSSFDAFKQLVEENPSLNTYKFEVPSALVDYFGVEVPSGISTNPLTEYAATDALLTSIDNLNDLVTSISNGQSVYQENNDSTAMSLTNMVASFDKYINANTLEEASYARQVVTLKDFLYRDASMLDEFQNGASEMQAEQQYLAVKLPDAPLSVELTSEGRDALKDTLNPLTKDAGSNYLSELLGDDGVLFKLQSLIEALKDDTIKVQVTNDMSDPVYTTSSML